MEDVTYVYHHLWLDETLLSHRQHHPVDHVGQYFNSLAPGKFEWNFRHVIFQRILMIDGWRISCEIALIWMSLDFNTDNQSTLVTVMAWCHQATSHYLSQCWPRSLLPYGITRPQWLNYVTYCSTQSCGVSFHPRENLIEREWMSNFIPHFIMDVITVGTPYNTTPYITGSNIARLGHGSQNSWRKLWIPIVKSAPVRVIFTWKSVPKKSIHGSSDIYLGTQWKQRHDSPWSYRSDVIVTFLWYGTIGIIWHRDHQYAAKKV